MASGFTSYRVAGAAAPAMGKIKRGEISADDFMSSAIMRCCFREFRSKILRDKVQSFFGLDAVQTGVAQQQDAIPAVEGLQHERGTVHQRVDADSLAQQRALQRLRRRSSTRPIPRQVGER